mmetsp:Transcript_22592/g.69800  ORF Transcript_22592/g.69800 Transcript_22592/m.69800 type:complete len:301 (+) Transcript_22592:108-1010(+)
MSQFGHVRCVGRRRPPVGVWAALGVALAIRGTNAGGLPAVCAHDRAVLRLGHDRARVVRHLARDAAGGGHRLGAAGNEEAAHLGDLVHFLGVDLAQVPPLPLQLGEGPPLQNDGLTVGRVVHALELIHRPVQPAHQEDAQREPMRDHHHRHVSVAPRVHIAYEVVLKDGEPVVHVCSALAVWESVIEAAELEALVLLAPLGAGVLEVSEVLLAQLHLFLRAHHLPPAEGHVHVLERLLAAAVWRKDEVRARHALAGRFGVVVHDLHHVSARQLRLLAAALSERDLWVGNARVRRVVHVAQ